MTGPGESDEVDEATIWSGRLRPWPAAPAAEDDDIDDDTVRAVASEQLDDDTFRVVRSEQVDDDTFRVVREPVDEAAAVEQLDDETFRVVRSEQVDDDTFRVVRSEQVDDDTFRVVRSEQVDDDTFRVVREPADATVGSEQLDDDTFRVVRGPLVHGAPSVDADEQIDDDTLRVPGVARGAEPDRGESDESASPTAQLFLPISASVERAEDDTTRAARSITASVPAAAIDDHTERSVRRRRPARSPHPEPTAPEPPQPEDVDGVTAPAVRRAPVSPPPEPEVDDRTVVVVSPVPDDRTEMRARPAETRAASRRASEEPAAFPVPGRAARVPDGDERERYRPRADDAVRVERGPRPTRPAAAPDAAAIRPRQQRRGSTRVVVTIAIVALLVSAAGVALIVLTL